MFPEIKVGQWRRDDFTYVVLAEPDRGLVLCEIRYRGVGAPKPEKVFMPASRVLRGDVVDAF